MNFEKPDMVDELSESEDEVSLQLESESSDRRESRMIGPSRLTVTVSWMLPVGIRTEDEAGEEE